MKTRPEAFTTRCGEAGCPCVTGRRWVVAVLAALVSSAWQATVPLPVAAGEAEAARTAANVGPRVITALGRLEPKDGIIQVAGPSRRSVVIADLLVDEGDRVEAGAPLAILDTHAEGLARVARAEAELANAETELARQKELHRRNFVSESLRDAAQLKVDLARTDLEMARAELERDTVRSPVSGQVLVVHARQGERVGPEGVAEIAQNDEMYAVAEIYETDIGRVRIGQRATMRSPALAADLTGTVERIGLKVGRLGLVDEDPAARTDARIVKVHIRLDTNEASAGLSNLQVEVSIDPGDP